MAFTVPGYQVDRLLGYGSHAEVWSGTAGDGTRVALKRIVLPRQGEPQRAAELATAARAEAALLAALEHPSLIRFHRYLQTPAAAVLVMELAEGGSLARLLRRRDRLSPAEVAAALSPIAAALAYAHEQGVRHGDVSAANILFTRIGQPKLADLGVARLLIGPAGTDQELGTPAYVDPVLAAGGPAGPASDVFSLAAVALHCLSGNGPWQAEGRTDLQAVLARAATGVIDDLTGRLAGCPPAMVAVLRRALAPEPLRRGSAAELALDLGASVPAGPVVLAAGRVPPRAGRHSVERQDPAVADAVPADLTHVARLQIRPEPGAPWLRTRPRRQVVAAAATVLLLAGAAAALGATALRRAGWPESGAAHRGPVAQPTGVGSPDTGAKGGAGTGVGSQADAGIGPGSPSNVPPTRTPTTAAAPPPSTPSLNPTAAATPTPRPTSAATRTPTSAPAAGTAGSESSAGTVPKPVDPLAVLRQLADRRSAAFALNRPDLLAGVYRSSSLLAQDVDLLGARVPAGCGLAGLRTDYRQVSVTSAGPGRLELRVTASQPPATLLCGGAARSRTLPAAPVRLALSLVRVEGEFKIAAQHRQPS